MFKNTFDPKVLDESPWRDKIKVIEGVWDWDEDQRNACVDAALEDDMDILMIHDEDEFYMMDDFGSMVDEIKSNPGHTIYCTPWLDFWKDWSWVVSRPQVPSSYLSRPEVAFSLKMGGRFSHTHIRTPRNFRQPHRVPDGPRGAPWPAPPPGRGVRQMDYTCFHGSYVLSDLEVETKLHSWSHAHQVHTGWLEEKWKNWEPGVTTNLHPLWPERWPTAARYKGPLPEVIEDLRERL